MTQPYYRRTTCRLCQESALETVLELPATPVGDSYILKERAAEPQTPYPLALVTCRSCGLLQIPDVVAPEILYGNYLYFTGISLGLAEHFERYAEAVLERVAPAPGSLVIDIGSNDGTLLKHFKDRGMKVLGVDPAVEMSKLATRHGIETVTEFFNVEVARKIRQQYGPANIVTANNVLANIDELSSVMEGIRELLGPEGVFVFETGYMPDLLQKTILDNVYHEHLSYCSVTPLNTFFDKNGMQLVDVRHVPTKGGSIRGFVQLAGGGRTPSQGVADMLRLEEILGFSTMEPYRAFAARAAAIREQLLALVSDLKKQGKTFAGYGASVGMTTLIYYLGLAPYLDYLVDDNQSRHHLLSPGLHLEVLPSEVLSERQPDYVILLAWQYSGPILKRHSAYQRAGGRFIIPLPEPRIA
jgi:SAM-dependent methyltransferase